MTAAGTALVKQAEDALSNRKVIYRDAVLVLYIFIIHIAGLDH